MYRPARPPLEKTWVWCPGCQDFSETSSYEDSPVGAKAPSRKVQKQGEKKKQSKQDKETEKKVKQVDDKVNKLRHRKKKRKVSCEERGCDYEGTKRGLSIHVTKTHLQKCDVDDCEFETTSAQGFSLHTTKMHPDKPPCSEHPRYTAQRKPRSGCDTCMKAYEKNR